MQRIFLSLCMFFLLLAPCLSQNKQEMKWWNPSEAGYDAISGRAWQEGLAGFYDRLPAEAEKSVRREVWALSHNSAGEYIRFRTDADHITVRYTVKESLNKPHMPSTGVSGVDLYILDSSGSWHWAKGTYAFGDTIEYRFASIDKSIRKKEYRLYLPLYNTIASLSIGIPGGSSFTPIAAGNEPAVVIYGTSIAQGACASRAGLAWTNMLGRKLPVPVINLGFSGNGQLEPALIGLLLQTNAKVFVLDCMPNLWDRRKFSEDTVAQRIIHSVHTLRRERPEVPILLTEHCSGLPGTNADSGMRTRYKATSELLRSTFARLQREGVTNIHLLKDSDIGFTLESSVDGTHPNDIGMMKYAEAYEKALLPLLQKKRIPNR